MPLKSLRIPFGFLIAGVIWSSFSDPLITILTMKANVHTRDIIRSINDLLFVLIVSVVLYFEIKKQHRRLIESEDQYRRLFELNPNPMWVVHMRTFRFVEVNDAATELYGYSVNEFLAMTIMDIRSESEKNRLYEHINKLEPGIRTSSNWKHLKKNGELLHVSIVSYDIEFNGEPCSLVMANDITGLILNEEKIKAQNNILQDMAWSNSHEVRRSLCSVMSLVDLMKNAENDSDCKQYLLLLEKCSADIDTLIKSNNKKMEALQDPKTSYTA
jgi:PAS domain S-box-containing protein